MFSYSKGDMGAIWLYHESWYSIKFYNLGYISPLIHYIASDPTEIYIILRKLMKLYHFSFCYKFFY